MAYTKPVMQQTKLSDAGVIFWLFWLVLLVLYFPAARAGFVTDFTGWLDQVQNHSFWEYINRTNFHAKSLYQFTQFNTYVFYKLFGIRPWAWHLLFITLHALNAYLLFRLVSSLLDDAGASNGRAISFSGALLFCMSPYMSEVIVWEPSFHYLQGLLLILLIAGCVQKFVHSGNNRYSRYAVIIYFLSAFSLEIFYITPWLILTLAFFYGAVTARESGAARKIIVRFFLPTLALFLLRFFIYKLIYGDWVSRIGTAAATTIPLSYLGKPAKYLFHLSLLGRFWPQEWKQRVYGFLASAQGLLVCYSIVGAIVLLIAVRFKKMSGKGKVASLLFLWTLIALAILIPLWFGDLLLVLFDRYNYFAAAFFYMLAVVLVSYIRQRQVRLIIVAVYLLANLRYAIQVSRFWAKSYKVDAGLLNNIPVAGNRVILLLNVPESMKGVPMIGSDFHSEYKLMHNLLLPQKSISNTVYDVLSYNMATPQDGAHVIVMNDSMIRVTLNQWGTWWWFAGKGGFSYENSDYKLNLIDLGHYYELTLKKPAQNYELLYSVGNEWKMVDWTKKNTDQY